MDQYIRGAIQSDLADIPGTYLQPKQKQQPYQKTSPSSAKSSSKNNGDNPLVTGTFLVAQDTATGRIVGSVAGEDKSDTLVDDDDSDSQSFLFELRRMSVDASLRRRGVGKLLLQGLQDFLIQQHHQQRQYRRSSSNSGSSSSSSSLTLFLTCSNLQYAAHGLYESNGFVKVKEVEYPLNSGGGWTALQSVFRVWFYRKVLVAGSGIWENPIV